MALSSEFRRALWRILLLGPLLAAGPVLVRNGVAAHGEPLLYDFRGGLYDAGRAILHGRHFYEPGFLARQVAIMRAGGIGLGELNTRAFSIPVYPALANLLVVPLALLPFWLAGALFTVACAAAMAGGLWLLGVREWRCFALALSSWPFLFGALLGAVGPLLVLGAGVAWRWRHRVLAPALAIAAIIAVKVFPWTLAVWLLVTRRRRAFLVCAAACLALSVGAWMAIGWEGLAQYPRMLSDLTLLQEGRAVSVATVLVIAGVAPAAAAAVALLLAGALLVLAWRLAGGPDGDRRAFGLAVLAALCATPIVWEHYMVLLFIPVALASPRLSALWLAPLASPLLVALSRLAIPDSPVLRPDSPDALRQALIWLALEAVVGVALVTTAPQRAAWRARLGLPWRRLSPAGSR